ncbi:MAG: selenide, water dikinase SelD, partial [Kofleriaceae bacterium]
MIRLTQYARGGGCAAKLRLGALTHVLQQLPGAPRPDIVVDHGYSDDAAVVRGGGERDLVLTADVIAPLVDDPETFGAIAATNAMSDVWAMGGRPVSALNLVAFPLDTLGADVLEQILRGGLDAADAAGVAVVGGHSIDDPEPKYGMAVTGVVDPRAVLTNAGGREGDALVLT